MSVLELTVQPRPDVSHYDVSFDLDGGRFSFSFYTNAASGGWSFDLSADGGEVLVRGLALTLGTDLLHPYRYKDVPPGILWVRDRGLNGRDPGPLDFVEGRAALYYLEADD
jgi:hypothetical protein